MVGVVDVNVRVSSHLKEELACDVDKRLRIISTKMLFKNNNTTKEVKGTSRFQLLYMSLCGP